MTEIDIDPAHSNGQQLGDPVVEPPGHVPEWLDPEVWVGRVPADLVTNPATGEYGYKCPWPGCNMIRPTMQGITLHRNRSHVSDRLKNLRKVRQQKTAQATLAVKKLETVPQPELIADFGSTAEVTEYLQAIRRTNHPDYEAYRKRLARAKNNGLPLTVFERQELERAIILIHGDTLSPDTEPAKPAGAAPVKKAPAKKATAKKDITALKADEVFNTIGIATKLIFGESEWWNRIQEIAQWQTMTMEKML